MVSSLFEQSFLRLSESSNSQNSKKKTTTLLSTSARKVQDEQTEPPLCNIDYLQSYLTLFHFCVLSRQNQKETRSYHVNISYRASV